MVFRNGVFSLILSGMFATCITMPAQYHAPDPSSKIYSGERPLVNYLVDLSAATRQLICYEETAWDSGSIANPARLAGGGARSWIGPASRRVTLPNPASSATSKRSAVDILAAALPAYAQQTGEGFRSQRVGGVIRVTPAGRTPLDTEVEVTGSPATALEAIKEVMQAVSKATGIEMIVDDAAFGYRFDAAFGQEYSVETRKGVARDLLQSILERSRTSTAWFVACELKGEAKRCIVNLTPLFADSETNGTVTRLPVLHDRHR